MKAFGIGCYHFGIETPAKMKVQDYINLLSNRLKKINSISEISIESEEFDVKQTIEVDERVDIMSESGILIPHLNFFRLNFSIFIPLRIQKELTKELIPLDTNTEHFSVTIIHDWFFSYSVVECLNPSEVLEPSLSVFIIREFLKKEFLKENEDKIIFDCLGPSPFHTNFFLKKSEKDLDDIIEYKKTNMRGYDTVNFIYNASKISEEDAFVLIVAELSSEIGFYYSITAQDKIRDNKWQSLEKKMSALIEKKPKGIFENLSSIFLNSKIDNLINEIAKFKMSEIFYKQQSSAFYGKVYDSGKSKGYLRDIVTLRYKEILGYPVEEFYDLIKLISDRNRKKIELGILFFAAICGGLVGSIITIAFT